MDIFAQKKLLVRLVILLVVLNLFSISVFLWKGFSHRPSPPPRPDKYHDVSAILKEKLDLTEQQVEQMNKLRSDYFEKENILSSTIREERDSINREMFNKTTNEELIKSLSRRVAENEYQMELLRFEQAQELKSICTPVQLEKFERLIIEIRDYFRPDNQPVK